MIALQKPISAFSVPSYHHQYRPTHSRNPSAPVVQVRPTHTPGLLSLSKPVNPPVSRPQQAQQHARAPRSPPKGKSQRSITPAQAQPVEESKKLSAPKPKTDAGKVSTTASSTSPEKSPRGRQPNKPASKDKADRRSISLSSSRTPARRPPHQPSPSPLARMPKQTESTARPSEDPLRAESLVHRENDSNLSDPFIVHPSSDNDSPRPAPAKANGAKPMTFRVPPELTTRPSGKLARRRQINGQAPSTPTPSKAVPVPRSKDKSAAQGHAVNQLSKSDSAAVITIPRRPSTRRVSTVLGLQSWDSFPVCDDSDDVTPPSTPVRESASVPSKRSGVTWQQQVLVFDDAPRTAPLSSTFGFPFTTPTPNGTPTPAQRRRNHRRIPSEGMFAMSMDEDSSSSDVSEELKSMVELMSKRRVQPSPSTRRSPSPTGSDVTLSSTPAGFYAGSAFQNSPSPDELPVPAFQA